MATKKKCEHGRKSCMACKTAPDLKKGAEEECICACHDTEWNSASKRKPLHHDTKCCEEMNGYIDTPTPQSWERTFDKEFPYYRTRSKKEVTEWLKSFISHIREESIQWAIKETAEQTIAAERALLKQKIEGMKKKFEKRPAYPMYPICTQPHYPCTLPHYPIQPYSPYTPTPYYPTITFAN